MSLLVQSFLSLFRSPLTTVFFCFHAALLGVLLWLVYRRRVNVRFILVVCVIWWSILSFAFPPKGSNYEIYQHNASLTLNGKSSFGRTFVPNVDYQQEPYKLPSYLDYTGAQHLLYVLMTGISFNNIHPRFSGVGFQLWSVLVGAALLWFLVQYNKTTISANINSEAVPLVVLVFHPVFSLHWLIYSWEDKIVFALIPVVLLVLIRGELLTAAAMGVGFIVSLNGLVLFWLPPFVIYLYRRYGISQQWFRLLGWIGAGVVVGLIPFFPNSLSGWEYRAARLNAAEPFWFSIYLLLPVELYHPLVDKLIIGALALLNGLLYWQRRWSIIDTLVVAISLVIIFGSYNAVARILPLVFVIMVLAPNVSLNNWLWFCGVISLYFFVSLGYSPENIQPIHVLVFYLPVAYALGVYILKRQGHHTFFCKGRHG